MSDDQAPPILMTYTGDGFSISPGFWQKAADQHYVIGERYRMLHENVRSAKSHRHMFAMINDAHANLSDDKLELHPSPEALRKHALIECGYCDQQSFVCSSEAEARRLAAFLKPVDEFSIILSKRNIVTRYIAKSMSVKALGNKEFQIWKDAILTWIAAQIGTTPAALSANAGASEGGQR